MLNITGKGSQTKTESPNITEVVGFSSPKPRKATRNQKIIRNGGSRDVWKEDSDLCAWNGDDSFAYSEGEEIFKNSSTKQLLLHKKKGEEQRGPKAKGMGKEEILVNEGQSGFININVALRKKEKLLEKGEGISIENKPKSPEKSQESARGDKLHSSSNNRVNQNPPRRGKSEITPLKLPTGIINLDHDAGNLTDSKNVEKSGNSFRVGHVLISEKVEPQKLKNLVRGREKYEKLDRKGGQYKILDRGHMNERLGNKTTLSHVNRINIGSSINRHVSMGMEHKHILIDSQQNELEFSYKLQNKYNTTNNRSPRNGTEEEVSKGTTLLLDNKDVNILNTTPEEKCKLQKMTLHFKYHSKMLMSFDVQILQKGSMNTARRQSTQNGGIIFDSVPDILEYAMLRSNNLYKFKALRLSDGSNITKITDIPKPLHNLFLVGEDATVAQLELPKLDPKGYPVSPRTSPGPFNSFSSQKKYVDLNCHGVNENILLPNNFPGNQGRNLGSLGGEARYISQQQSSVINIYPTYQTQKLSEKGADNKFPPNPSQNKLKIELLKGPTSVIISGGKSRKKSGLQTALEGGATLFADNLRKIGAQIDELTDVGKIFGGYRKPVRLAHSNHLDQATLIQHENTNKTQNSIPINAPNIPAISTLPTSNTAPTTNIEPSTNEIVKKGVKGLLPLMNGNIKIEGLLPLKRENPPNESKNNSQTTSPKLTRVPLGSLKHFEFPSISSNLPRSSLSLLRNSSREIPIPIPPVPPAPKITTTSPTSQEKDPITRRNKEKAKNPVTKLITKTRNNIESTKNKNGLKNATSSQWTPREPQNPVMNKKPPTNKRKAVSPISDMSEESVLDNSQFPGKKLQSMRRIMAFQSQPTSPKEDILDSMGVGVGMGTPKDIIGNNLPRTISPTRSFEFNFGDSDGSIALRMKASNLQNKSNLVGGLFPLQPSMKINKQHKIIIPKRLGRGYERGKRLITSAQISGIGNNPGTVWGATTLLEPFLEEASEAALKNNQPLLSELMHSLAFSKKQHTNLNYDPLIPNSTNLYLHQQSRKWRDYMHDPYTALGVLADYFSLAPNIVKAYCDTYLQIVRNRTYSGGTYGDIIGDNYGDASHSTQHSPSTELGALLNEVKTASNIYIYICI